MPAQPPYGHSFNPAQQAQDAQRLLRYVKTHLPSKSPSMLVRRTPTGTVQTPIAQPNGGTFYNRRQIPTFYVYLSAGTNTGTINVRITGGTISHIYNGFSLWVPGTVSDLALSENDYVWLERTGNNAWGFGYGASFPEDKISFQLAKILLGGDGKLYVDYTGGWSGGDIIVSEQFPVALTQTGGGAGDATTMCSFSYSVATLDGVTLAELSSSTPVLSLARVIPFLTTAATRGTVRILADGSLVLWDCDEKQTNPPVVQFPVALTQTGGSGGDATTMCSFTYSVTTLDGVTLAELSNSTPVLSLARVIPGSTTAATRGTVRRLPDGSLVLWDCDEKQTNTVVERLQTANCP